MRLTLLLITILLTAGCSQSVGYDSPEEVYAAEQAARRNHDFGKAFDCLTPDSQEFHVGMILSGISAAKKQASLAKKAPQGLERWQTHLQEMVELARRHGVDVAALPDDVSVFDADACRALAVRFPVDNRREFFAEYWQMFTDAQESMTGKKLYSEEFTLSELKYEGDSASAIKQREDETMQLPVAFKKINGKWFVDDVAKLKQGQFPVP